jgi:hypothetical protein
MRDSGLLIVMKCGDFLSITTITTTIATTAATTRHIIF